MASAFTRYVLPTMFRKRRSVVASCRPPQRAPVPLPTSHLTSVQLCGQRTLAAGPLTATAAPNRVRRARALDEDRVLEVEWGDEVKSLYPFTWLRDNCPCPLCTLQSAQARCLPLSQLDVHTGIGAVRVAGDKVSIIWPDKHASEFDPEWLRRRCFSSASRRAMREELFLDERIHWDSTLRVPTADFQEILRDDGAALAWLLALRRVGIVHVKGAPAERGQVTRLSERIGYPRLTFYGHTWQVRDKPMANNVAYTSGALGLHTDYPALHNPPGVQFLHCLSRAREGGESLAADGFHVAEQLQREDPEAFRCLASTRVDFADAGRDYCEFAARSKNHVIDVDREGRVSRINYNNATRDSVLDLPVRQVQPFYRAIKAYAEITERPQNVAAYRMEPGDVVTLDNHRVLHGRRSYVDGPRARRHLEGAYLDWDEVMSRLRVLRGSVSGGK